MNRYVSVDTADKIDDYVQFDAKISTVAQRISLDLKSFIDASILLFLVVIRQMPPPH
jgi:hypothetical protein